MHHQPDRLRPGPAAVNGIIERLPGANTWVLTQQGQRVAIFCTKVLDRLLCRLLTVNVPPAPVELRDSLRTIDRHVRNNVSRAWLTVALHSRQVNESWRPGWLAGRLASDQ
jgi:hypothetical protein